MSEKMSEKFAVEIAPGQKVTAIRYPAARPKRARVTLILGHGAGAGQASAFMVSFATELAARGIDTVTFNFLYTEQGRRLPDPNGKLEACYRAVIEAVRQRKIGGGKLAGQILTCMEAALNRTAKEYSRYGSTTLKQVYLYGGLDTGPTEFVRSFGMAWSMGGWLLFPFLQKVGPERAQALKARVAAELKTTFASRYSRTISMAEALQLDTMAAYGKRATGEKFLIDPSRG